MTISEFFKEKYSARKDKDNQNTCCEAHRQQRATELRKIREKKRLKRKPTKKNKLAEICEIAKSKGMSYGQYMAEQYKKEVMIR